MVFETVNESPAAYFYQQMRIRKEFALAEWREPRLPSFNGGSLCRDEYLELMPDLRLSFSDYWSEEERRWLYEATQDCIRALVSQGVRENAEN